MSNNHDPGIPRPSGSNGMNPTRQQNGNNNQPGPSQDFGNDQRVVYVNSQQFHPQSIQQYAFGYQSPPLQNGSQNVYQYAPHPQNLNGYQFQQNHNSVMYNQAPSYNNGSRVGAVSGADPSHQQTVPNENGSLPGEAATPNCRSGQRVAQAQSNNYHHPPYDRNEPPESSGHNPTSHWNGQGNFNKSNQQPAQRGRQSKRYNPPRNIQQKPQNQRPPPSPLPAFYGPYRGNNPEQRNPTMMWRMSDGAYVPVETMGYAIEQAVLTMTSVEQKLTEVLDALKLNTMEMSGFGNKIDNLQSEMVALKSVVAGNVPVEIENKREDGEIGVEEDAESIRTPSIPLPEVINQLNENNGNILVNHEELVDVQEVGKQTDAASAQIQSISDIVHDVDAPDAVQDIPIPEVVRDVLTSPLVVSDEVIDNHVSTPLVVQNSGDSSDKTNNQISENTVSANTLEGAIKLETPLYSAAVEGNRAESAVFLENSMFSNNNFPALGQSPSSLKRSSPTGRSLSSSQLATSSYCPTTRRNITLKDFLLPKNRDEPVLAQPISPKSIKTEILKPVGKTTPDVKKSATAVTAPPKNPKMPRKSGDNSNASKQSKQAKKIETTPNKVTNATTSVNPAKCVNVVKNTQVPQASKVAVAPTLEDPKHVPQSTTTLKEAGLKAATDPEQLASATPKVPNIVHPKEKEQEETLCNGEVVLNESSETKPAQNDNPAVSDLTKLTAFDQEEKPFLNRKQRKNLEYRRKLEEEKLARKAVRPQEQKELLSKAAEQEAVVPKVSGPVRAQENDQQPPEEYMNPHFLVVEGTDEHGRPISNIFSRQKLLKGPTAEVHNDLRLLLSDSEGKMESFNRCSDPMKYFRDRLAFYSKQKNVEDIETCLCCFKLILSSREDIFKWHAFCLGTGNNLSMTDKFFNDLEYLDFLNDCQLA